VTLSRPRARHATVELGPSFATWGVRLSVDQPACSLAQKQPDLFEEALGGGLVLQRHVVPPFERNEAGAGDSRCDPAPLLDWNPQVAATVHYQGRREIRLKNNRHAR
jgi:hypothetical protein